jgi:hypothetical protein
MSSMIAASEASCIPFPFTSPSSFKQLGSTTEQQGARNVHKKINTIFIVVADVYRVVEFLWRIDALADFAVIVLDAFATSQVIVSATAKLFVAIDDTVVGPELDN